MTVKELIEKLKEFPQNLEVFTYDHEWGYSSTGNPKLKENITIQEGFFQDNVQETYYKLGVVI